MEVTSKWILGLKWQYELPVFPIGFTLFHERAQTFLRILEAVKFVEKNVHGVLEAVAQRESHTAQDGLLGHGEHGAGMAVDAVYEVVDRFFELRFGDEAIDHAEIESAFGGDRLARKYEFESDFWTDEKRENGGRKRRKNANTDFGLGKPRFGRGDHKVTEGREFRTAANGRTIYHANDGLAEFKHARKSGMKGIEHLEDALGSVFADVNSAAKDFASGIKDNQFDVIALAGVADAVGHFAEHGFVEEVVLGAVHGHARDAAVATELYELEFVGRALHGR